MMGSFLSAVWIRHGEFERGVSTRFFFYGIVCWVRFIMGCILLHFNGLMVHA